MAPSLQVYGEKYWGIDIFITLYLLLCNVMLMCMVGNKIAGGERWKEVTRGYEAFFMYRDFWGDCICIFGSSNEIRKHLEFNPRSSVRSLVHSEISRNPFVLISLNPL